jgi:hypothetical protein
MYEGLPRCLTRHDRRAVRRTTNEHHEKSREDNGPRHQRRREQRTTARPTCHRRHTGGNDPDEFESSTDEPFNQKGQT